MDKNKILIQKTITIVIVVALLFTSGFVLGAVTAEIKELSPVVEQVTESTTAPTTEAPTTQAPVTEAPTTTAAPTTEAPTEAPTTEEPSTEAPTESTTESTTEAPAEETTEEEPCLLIQIILKLLDFKKQIIDFVISILSSF